MSSNAKKAGPATQSGPFDVKIVESLVALMTENDLSEIYLRDGNQHLRLRRGAAGPAMVPAAVPVCADHRRSDFSAAEHVAQSRTSGVPEKSP